MAWKIEWDRRALKEMKKIDKQVQKQIFQYLKSKVGSSKNPRQFGKVLTGDMAGLWRYRVGDYRLICRIEDHELVVLVLRVAHRKKVYKKVVM